MPAANPLGGLRAFQFLPPFLNLPNSVEPGRTNDDNISYSARAAYKFDRHWNAYATYATGFKASSINLSRDSRPLLSDAAALTAARLTQVNQSYGSRIATPENSEVYEVGLKAQFDHVAFNFAAFYQDVRGFQNNTFNGTGFTLSNAGKQSVQGFEFDGSVTPIAPLTINLAVTYLASKYDSFVHSGIFVNGVEQDLTGRRPAGIAPISFVLGGVYTAQLGNENKALFRIDYNYESSVRIVDTLDLRREVNNINAAVVLQLHNGFEFSVWGRNLLNDQYLTTVFPSVAQSGSISGYPSQPRTYGVEARVKF